MLLRRILTLVPVLLLFSGTALIFMAARAPRTWAAHWTAPVGLVTAAGENEYGAVQNPSGGWDLLWYDDNHQRLMFTSVLGSGRAGRSFAVDTGDISQPTLLRIGGYELGAWVHDHNGSTDLMAAYVAPGPLHRTFRLVGGAAPLERPYLFRARGGSFGLVFSWQRYGNFDVFLLTVPSGRTRPARLLRLTRSQYYGFSPRAVVDGRGNLDLLHVESCCRQLLWNVVYDRYDAAGRHLGPTRRLYQSSQYSGRAPAVPARWAEALLTDGQGNVWGAYGGDAGAFVFHMSADGRMLAPPRMLDDTGNTPPVLALTLDAQGGYLLWEQPYDLGTYVDSRRFSQTGAAAAPAERVVYESGSQTGPHAAVVQGETRVVWETVTRGLYSRFEEVSYRPDDRPTLAQRLGLGLGNPWETVGVLVVSSLGVAVLTTVGNLLMILVLAVGGLLAVRLLRPVPGRWLVYAVLVTAALYVSFVAPGGPILFLSTMPSMGLAAVPFGLIAAGGALLFVSWTGTIALKRMEDPFRAGLMVIFGVYFFAFVEAIVFIQQRLGYI
jgi:hypothetical protein